jgi:hypothetical protein
MAAVVQFQGFIQPVEDDLVFVREGAGLAMIFRPICGGESNNFLRNPQRVINLLRLSQEKHVPVGFQNEAGALNLSGDALHRVLLGFLHEIGKTQNPEGVDAHGDEPAQSRVVLHEPVDNLFEAYGITPIQSINSLLRDEASNGLIEVIHAVEENRCAESVLESYGASTPKSAQAHADEYKIVPTIDVVTRKELKNPAAKTLLGIVQGEFGKRITVD